LHTAWLCEQLRQNKATQEEVALTLGRYVKRWQCWTSVGLRPKRLSKFPALKMLIKFLANKRWQVFAQTG
jgi:hypothetical protein